MPHRIKDHKLLLLAQIDGTAKLLHLVRLLKRFILSICMYGVEIIFVLDHFIIE